MFNISEIRKIANLNDKEITITWKIVLDKQIILSVRWKYTTCNCPSCWLKTSKRKDKVFLKKILKN